jgi:lysophospholipase L1-like esterase
MRKSFKMNKLLKFSLFFNLIFVGFLALAFVKIGSPRYLFYLMRNRGQGIVSLKNHRHTHLNSLPIPTGKIIMLGNSITAECEWAELLENDSIVNRGVIGDGTFDILERLTPIISAKPKKIFLLIGVNDLLFHPLSTIAENYEKIVKRIREETPETDVYVESILPIHNDLRRNGLKNDDINTLNGQIFELSKKYKITYIDLASKLRNTEGGLKEELSLDGIHINGDGYLILRETLKQYIE